MMIALAIVAVFVAGLICGFLLMFVVAQNAVRLPW
jgi:hypothetical protein